MYENKKETSDSQLNAKFDLLYSRVMKNLMKEFPKYTGMERSIHKKYSEFVQRTNQKVGEKCAEPIEKIKLYAVDFDEKVIKNIYQASIQDIPKYLRTKPGNEREFLEAFKDITECSSKIYAHSDEIKNKLKMMSNLTKETNDFCVEDCKREIKEFKKSENEAANCIQTCWRYKKLNIETCYEITENLFDTKDKILSNL